MGCMLPNQPHRPSQENKGAITSWFLKQTRPLKLSLAPVVLGISAGDGPPALGAGLPNQSHGPSGEATGVTTSWFLKWTRMLGLSLVPVVLGISADDGPPAPSLAAKPVSPAITRNQRGNHQLVSPTDKATGARLGAGGLGHQCR